MKRAHWMAGLVTGLGVFLGSSAAAAEKPAVMTTLKEVPVGIATSPRGRIFVSYSRAIDPLVKSSVAELKGGKPMPFPPGLEQDRGMPDAKRLLSVQALSVDEKNRLWLLDCGVVGTNAVEPGSPKLVAVDLNTDKVVKTIEMPKDIAGPTSFLNDLRIDVNRGTEGTVFITDAAPRGPNGLVVVDIATGKAQRRLNAHASTKPVAGMTVVAQGQPLIQKKGPDLGQPFAVGADGIALSPDGKFLYYAPLTSRNLYRVSTDALVQGDAQAVKSVEDLGDKGFASDGLLMDAQGRLYATDYEKGAIHRRSADGKWEVIANENLVWPDTLALLPDGTLLVTETQIQQSGRFKGWDQRKTPFEVSRIRTDSKATPMKKAQGRATPTK